MLICFEIGLKSVQYLTGLFLSQAEYSSPKVVPLNGYIADNGYLDIKYSLNNCSHLPLL